MGSLRRGTRALSAAAVTLAAGVLAAGLSVAPAPSAAPASAGTYDTGSASSSVTVAPVYRTVAIRRCTSYRYYPATRVTVCLSYRLGSVYVRMYGGSIVQQRSRTGVWVRIPYVWSSKVRALVYNHWLYLQLHRTATTTTASPTPTASPTTSPVGSLPPSPTTSSSSPAPSPTITASRLPLPAGTGLSPTPTSTLAGEAAAESTSYAYIATPSGAPTPLPAASAPRWDKCLPITWSLDLANAGKAGTTAADELARWQSTMDVASRVTGYTFQYVPGGTGKVTIDPVTNQPVSTAWTATGATLLITYVSPTDTGAYKSAAVGGATIGYTSVSWLNYDSTHLMMSKASIQLEYGWLSTASEGDHYNLLLHEFGHALGLGHVTDTTQVMNPYISHQDLFRLGDRTGLWQLAQQPCR